MHRGARLDANRRGNLRGYQVGEIDSAKWGTLRTFLRATWRPHYRPRVHAAKYTVVFVPESISSTIFEA